MYPSPSERLGRPSHSSAITTPPSAGLRGASKSDSRVPIPLITAPLAITDLRQKLSDPKAISAHRILVAHSRMTALALQVTQGDLDGPVQSGSKDSRHCNWELARFR
jgi:hypothetical protein